MSQPPLQKDFVAAAPGLPPAADFNGPSWRRRYFGAVGTVCRLHDEDRLVLFYAARLEEYRALRAELDAAPGNVNAVLAACDDERRRQERGEPAPAGEQLGLALVAASVGAGLTVRLHDVVSRQWQSVTFTGARHRVELRMQGIQAAERADRLVAGIAGGEWPLRGHLLADLAVVDDQRETGLVRLTFDALTVAAGS